MRVSGHDERCQRLAQLEGVGPLVAAVGNAHQFKSGRELSSWLGLVTRQYSRQSCSESARSKIQKTRIAKS